MDVKRWDIKKNNEKVWDWNSWTVMNDTTACDDDDDNDNDHYLHRIIYNYLVGSYLETFSRSHWQYWKQIQLLIQSIQRMMMTTMALVMTILIFNYSNVISRCLWLTVPRLVTYSVITRFQIITKIVGGGGGLDMKLYSRCGATRLWYCYANDMKVPNEWRDSITYWWAAVCNTGWNTTPGGKHDSQPLVYVENSLREIISQYLSLSLSRYFWVIY